MKKPATRELVLAAMFVVLGVLFPGIFHFFGATAGKVFLPMHIPVLVCGLACGPLSGALCGLVTPLLSSAATGMPVLFPQGVAMMCELCVYGLVAGLLGRRFGVYPALLGAMLAGRAASGLAFTVLFAMTGTPYTLEAFVSSAFVVALPGIAIQLAVVPLLTAGLKKTGVFGARSVRLV